MALQFLLFNGLQVGKWEWPWTSSWQVGTMETSLFSEALKSFASIVLAEDAVSLSNKPS
jgi:hypothetical protein